MLGTSVRFDNACAANTLERRLFDSVSADRQKSDGKSRLIAAAILSSGQMPPHFGRSSKATTCAACLSETTLVIR